MDTEREKEFLEVINAFPDDALTRFGFGNFYRDSGETEKAIEQYRKAIECDSGYGAAYLELGALYEHTDRADLAREVYTQAITAAEQKGDQHIINRAKLRLDNLP